MRTNNLNCEISVACCSSLLRSSSFLDIPQDVRRGRLFQTISLVDVLHHRHFLEQEECQDPDAAQTDHNLPDDGHTQRERRAHLGPQRLLKTSDERDRLIRDVGPSRELGCERGGGAVFELVLQDGAGDGDAPGLPDEGMSIRARATSVLLLTWAKVRENV